MPTTLGVSPTITSPTAAARRIADLQHASVSTPRNGFGEKPSSWERM